MHESLYSLGFEETHLKKTTQGLETSNTNQSWTGKSQ